MTKAHKSPPELRDMFGSNLRLLSRRYPSISELSRQLGINRTQFNRYLSGESFPRPDVLDKICRFFGVDARILLEPVARLDNRGLVLNGSVLAEYLGASVENLPESIFPNGFYRFSRRSFVSDTQFTIGLVYVFRDDGWTCLRGYEASSAMVQQGLPADARNREFRGYVAQQEDGVAIIAARHNGMTCSFNYLTRVASFENNYWVGYVTRTVRESATGTRVTRLVYEHLGHDRAKVMAAARGAGIRSEADLLAYHRRLLRTDEPFR